MPSPFLDDDPGFSDNFGASFEFVVCRVAPL